ncbi:hypothetical protein F2N31_11785 [Escherichia coli]|nr:hypothetical protein [Escherichia coli]
MIDLETMGTGPDAQIASIGAVFFDPQIGEMGPEFNKTIDMKTGGGTVNISTIEWCASTIQRGKNCNFNR